ncbi:hypothetical protein FHS51_003092 [Sphingobium wenxiniae]|uniref:Oligosaccharide repeat unit polymerase n=1 Tax=Sphingobium wenxiniae (strain DSM 21828 / CGMCC 1.7748 / JZ-1) TaxID=595605 RepID=A0A562K530_SPHWJ|nr:hypothetical protein [Sphingobium wenxiniae]MBB6192838.1 hypothetical protein [Sphingobium wenxiniae]TWH90530.1 hypothetical protein IQ35_03354 [Sphingobium wenxiniae]
MTMSVSQFRSDRGRVYPGLVDGHHHGSLPSRTRKTLFAPIRFSLLYLLTTFGLFLISNLVSDVSNLGTLISFVMLSFAGLYLGYYMGIAPVVEHYKRDQGAPFGDRPSHRWLVIAGALYFTVWGINQFYDFGGTDLQSIVRTILSPGEAYQAKFDVFSERIETKQVNRITQILIILSIIYAVFLPLAVVSWSRLNRYIKALTILGVTMYVTSFLFIGTMKGIGDIVLFLITGVSVILARQSLSSAQRIVRTRIYVMIGITSFAFFTYMAINQVQRAEQFGISESGTVGNISDTLLVRTIGYDAAFGIYQTLAYPSHGYRGLAYSLEQPFEFSHGAGFSQAYESYRLQFLGGEDNRYLTYPYRAERITGWPAGMYWSTIFPWLASDLSFFGVPIFMILMGFIFARLWIACLYNNNPFALAAVGQMIIFIAFIPANNQVLMQRQGLWAVITLIGIGLTKYLARRQPVR